MLYRGPDRPKVLFIAEAPGAVEVSLKKPLVGPAGKLFWRMIERVLDDVGTGLTVKDIGATNVIACFPASDEPRAPRGFRKPTQEEAKACQPRLYDTLINSDPEAVVLCGNVANQYAAPLVRSSLSVPSIKITHPSFWARSGGLESLPAQEARMALAPFLLQHFPTTVHA